MRDVNIEVPGQAWLEGEGLIWTMRDVNFDISEDYGAGENPSYLNYEGCKPLFIFL